MILTIVSALVSKLDSKSVILLVLMFSALKFLGIAFEFMEMKKAHLFWKVMIVGFLVVFVALTAFLT